MIQTILSVGALTVSLLTLVAGLWRFRHQERRLIKEFDAKYRTQTSLEGAIHRFLGIGTLRFRSLRMIQHHIGGFAPNELRAALVRAGAVRFAAADGTEMWALLSGVEEEFVMGHWRLKDAPHNPPPDGELFPAALPDEGGH